MCRNLMKKNEWSGQECTVAQAEDRQRVESRWEES